MSRTAHALITLMAISCRPAAPPSDAPRTAVLIVLDTVRADALEPWGAAPGRTPNIQSLAAQSTTWTRAYAAAPWTLPSHATLFSGLAPADHNCHHGTLKWNSAAPLLAERFADAGYATAGFSNNPWISSLTGLDAGLQTFADPYPRSVSAGTTVGRFTSPLMVGTDDSGAARSIAALDRWLTAQGDGPAFAFVNLIEAHLPYDPPDPWRGRWQAERPTISDVTDAYAGWLDGAHQGALTDADRTRARALYAQEVGYVDAQLGALLAVLERHGRADALVVLTSDHGDAFGDATVDGVDLIDHQLSLRDELLHVPLMARWPGTLPAGERRTDTVGLIDVAPLFAMALGDGEGGPLFQGAGPTRQLQHNYQPPHSHRPMLEHHLDDEVRIERLTNRGWRAVREGALKLVQPTDGPPQLYDLSQDPMELRDISARRPDAVARLRPGLPPLIQSSDAPAQIEQVEALKALGYVQ